MPDMAKRTEMSKMYVRPTPEARHALRRLMADVSAPELLGEVFQEDFVAATWMWLRTLDPGEVARNVGPYVRKLQAEFGEVTEAAPTVGETVVTRKSQGRRRKSAG